MKKIIYSIMGIASIMTLVTSCKKNFDDVQKPLITTGPTLDTLVGVISTNTTLTRNTYLYGLVYVQPGVVLTINPGVTIYGSKFTALAGDPGVVLDPTTGAPTFDTLDLRRNKGTLCIQRGAQINAAGNAAQPIVWTSDNKIPAGSRAYGDWGGLIIYGAATFHNSVGNTLTTRFEAFDKVPSRQENFYGGSNDADNSGVLTFNRFEFGGGVVTEINKEVNGLTLCAVGSGTVINNIEVLKAGDDGIEWFGGAVNCDHLFVYATKDDDFDMDEGYHGNLTYIVGLRDTTCDNSGSHLIEIDNDALASNFTPYTSPIISNATLIGPSARKDRGPADAFHAVANAGRADAFFEGAILTRRRASLRLINSYVIANEMPYGVQFTPTTGTTGAVLLDPPSTVTPGNVQGWNTYSTNPLNPSYNSYIIQSPVEGNGTAIYPGGLFAANDAGDLNKIISAANFNAGLSGQAAFNLGVGFANTTATPGYNTGLVYNGNGGQKGGVLTTDDWLLNNYGVGKLISITTN